MLNLMAFWLNVFAVDTVRYLLGAGSVAFILLVVFRRFSETRRIQHRRANSADYRREIFLSLQTTAVYAIVAIGTLQLKQMGLLHIYDEVEDYPLWYTVFSLPLVLVLHDAYFYWVHRAMHLPVLFRLAHAAHHRSRTPTPWAAYAFAPLEAVLMALFFPLVNLAIPVYGPVLFMFLAIMIVRNAMGHSGIEFHPPQWVDGPFDCLTTVVHHDLHHQRTKGNFGLYFTWWDRWMGTEFADYKQRFREVAAEVTTSGAQSR